jgi:hypothetical protein
MCQADDLDQHQRPADKRSYRVDFTLFRSLAPDSIPQVTLDQSIIRLREGLVGMGFAGQGLSRFALYAPQDTRASPGG